MSTRRANGYDVSPQSLDEFRSELQERWRARKGEEEREREAAKAARLREMDSKMEVGERVKRWRHPSSGSGRRGLEHERPRLSRGRSVMAPASVPGAAPCVHGAAEHICAPVAWGPAQRHGDVDAAAPSIPRSPGSQDLAFPWVFLARRNKDHGRDRLSSGFRTYLGTE